MQQQHVHFDHHQGELQLPLHAGEQHVHVHGYDEGKHRLQPHHEGEGEHHVHMHHE